MQHEAERQHEGRSDPQPRPAGSASGEPGAGPGTAPSDKRVDFRKMKKAEVKHKGINRVQ